MKVEPAEIRKALQSPRSKKYGLRFLIAVILIGVLGFFAFPPIVKYVAVKKLSELLHRPVAIQSISINPYVMSRNVRVKRRLLASTACMSIFRPVLCSVGGR